MTGDDHGLFCVFQQLTLAFADVSPSSMKMEILSE
jgi:hypothetical protein